MGIDHGRSHIHAHAYLGAGKNPKVITAVGFAGFVSDTFVPYLIFSSGVDDPSCGRWDYSRQRDLSPTLFLLLDIVIGMNQWLLTPFSRFVNTPVSVA